MKTGARRGRRTRRSCSAASAARSPRSSRTRAFRNLDAPVRRVGAQDSFVPFAQTLELAILPANEQIRDAIREVAKF